MTAIRSVDSFKYGARLLAYFLLVLIVGGGLLALGGTVGYSDAQRFLDGSGYDSAELAGGAVLAVLGGFVLLAGMFGVAHKLIADSVATGRPKVPSEAVSTVADSADTSDATGTGTTGPSPGEQVAQKHDGDQTVPSGAETDSPGSANEQPTTGQRDSGGSGTEATGSGPADQPQDWTEDLGSLGSEGDGNRPTSTSADTSTGGIEPGPGESEETAGSADETARTGDRQQRPEPSPEEIAFGTNSTAESEQRDPFGGGDESGEDGLVSDSELDEGSSVDPSGSAGSGDPLADSTDEE